MLYIETHQKFYEKIGKILLSQENGFSLQLAKIYAVELKHNLEKLGQYCRRKLSLQDRFTYDTIEIRLILEKIQTILVERKVFSNKTILN